MKKEKETPLETIEKIIKSLRNDPASTRSWTNAKVETFDLADFFPIKKQTLTSSLE